MMQKAKEGRNKVIVLPPPMSNSQNSKKSARSSEKVSPSRETEDEFLKKLQEENKELEKQIRQKASVSVPDDPQKSNRNTPIKNTELRISPGKSSSGKKYISGKIIKNSFQSDSKNNSPQKSVENLNENEKDELIMKLKNEIDYLKNLKSPIKSPERVQHLEGELEKMAKIIENLQNELGHLREENDQKEINNSELLKENQKLQEKLAKKKAKYKDLKIATEKYF